MPADALAPKVASASAGIVLTVLDSIVIPELISSTCLSQIHDTIQNVNISFIIFKTIQLAKS